MHTLKKLKVGKNINKPKLPDLRLEDEEWYSS